MSTHYRLALPPALLEKLPEPAADASVKTMSEPAPLRSDSAEGKRAHCHGHQGHVQPVHLLGSMQQLTSVLLAASIIATLGCRRGCQGTSEDATIAGRPACHCTAKDHASWRWLAEVCGAFRSWPTGCLCDDLKMRVTLASNVACWPMCICALCRAFEDSAMQLFQGQTSSETASSSEQAISRQQGQAASEDSQYTQTPQQQWQPLRHMSVPLHALAHAAPSALPTTGMRTTPGDSMRPMPAASARPTPLPADFSASVAGDASITASSAAANMQEGHAAQSIGREPEGSSAAGTSCGAAPPHSPPPHQVLTPFELAARGSPFSVRSAAAASPAAVDPAASEPEPGQQGADRAAGSGGDAGPDLTHASAPPRPDLLDTLQPAAQDASAESSTQPAQPPRIDVHVAESAPPAAPGYRSPFETAAELQPAFSLAPLVPHKGTQEQAGSGAAAAAADALEQQTQAAQVQQHGPPSGPGASEGARLPPAHGSGSLPPSAAPSAAASHALSSAGGNVSNAHSMASIPSSQPSSQPSAAAGSCTSAQGREGFASGSSASSLSKRQLAERLRDLKAAQVSSCVGGVTSCLCCSQPAYSVLHVCQLGCSLWRRARAPASGWFKHFRQLWCWCSSSG